MKKLAVFLAGAMFLAGAAQSALAAPSTAAAIAGPTTARATGVGHTHGGWTFGFEAIRYSANNDVHGTIELQSADFNVQCMLNVDSYRISTERGVPGAYLGAGFPIPGLVKPGFPCRDMDSEATARVEIDVWDYAEPGINVDRVTARVWLSDGRYFRDHGKIATGDVQVFTAA
jgi:hypothetical protein